VKAPASVLRLWAEEEDLVDQLAAVRGRLEAEVARLAKTKHRQDTLELAYWDELERIPTSRLVYLFRAKTAAALTAEAGARKTETTCLLCGAHFLLWLTSRSSRAALGRETATANPKWRSCPACDRERLRELKKLKKGKGERLTVAHRAAYQRYLQSPQWKERRDRAVKKAGAKCALCSSKGRLDVHHRFYGSIGEERPQDLIVLCRGCHEKFHDH
jgi:hypothetical protein